MNGMPKVVVSTTLTKATWNNTTIISDNVPDEVAALKGRYDGDILVAGSSMLVDTLRAHDLVDEYRLMVHPVVLGTGKPFKGRRRVHRSRAGRHAQGRSQRAAAHLSAGEQGGLTVTGHRSPAAATRLR